jgi:UDP-N-acetylglucosamine acyltransferase
VIDNRAEIHPGATIADNVTIGPWSVIGDKVEIDEGTVIGSHAVIKGPCKIGKNNQIFQFSSIGDVPQDLTHKDEETWLIIGDNNIIREYSMISRGTTKGDGKTVIGNNNFFMAHTHVGHDCRLANHIIMVNHSALSGHVIVDSHVNIGAYAAVHQFCHIGAHAFVAKATYVTKDVLPFVIVDGASPRCCGINRVGLKRHGFSQTDVELIRRAYKIIFRNGLTVSEALDELEKLRLDSAKIVALIDGLKASSRGIVR